MEQAPAIVAYMSHLGLGLVRALGRAGVPVYAMDPRPDALGMNSRYCTPVVTPDIKQDEKAYLDFLLEFGRKLPARGVLFPTGDPTVVLFSRERERLSEFYHYAAPDHETVLRLLTKDGLAETARDLGIPAPVTAIPADRAAVEAAAGDLPYPVILKPAESHSWKRKAITDLIGVGTKVVPCGDADELLAHYDRLAPHEPRLIVQEMIPGDDTCLFYFCFCLSRDGEPLGVFAGRKTRVLPPSYGSASFAEAIHDPGLTEVALALLRGVGYRGLGGIEYKRDPRTNEYKIIEVNVRFGLWDALGARCGVNLALMAYRDALGQPVQPVLEYPANAKWVSFERDLSAFKLYRRQGKLTTRQWLRSLRGRKMWAVFAWDDLKPWLATTPGYLWSRIAPRLGMKKK